MKKYEHEKWMDKTSYNEEIDILNRAHAALLTGHNDMVDRYSDGRWVLPNAVKVLRENLRDSMVFLEELRVELKMTWFELFKNPEKMVEFLKATPTLEVNYGILGSKVYEQTRNIAKVDDAARNLIRSGWANAGQKIGLSRSSAMIYGGREQVAHYTLALDQQEFAEESDDKAFERRQMYKERFHYIAQEEKWRALYRDMQRLCLISSDDYQFLKKRFGPCEQGTIPELTKLYLHREHKKFKTGDRKSVV